MIKWKDPPIPNGPIIKYMIEYDKGGLSQVGKFFFKVGDLVIHIYHVVIRMTKLEFSTPQRYCVLV